jgi:hypothetical protein
VDVLDDGAEAVKEEIERNLVGEDQFHSSRTIASVKGTPVKLKLYIEISIV